MSLTLIEARDQRRFSCGPLDVRVRADDPTLRTRITEHLGIYVDGWVGPQGRVDVWIRNVAFRRAAIAGNYAHDARLCVDRTPGGLIAVTQVGACAECVFTGIGDYWKIDVPDRAVTPAGLADVERLIDLSLMVGWQRRGYVPLECAGVVSKGGRCAIIASDPNSGASTLAAALVRDGWRTLGDRRLLLQCDANGPRLHALITAFSLHPEARSWFPELGRLDYQPRYPSWSDKRRVVIEHAWPGGSITCAVPTHIVRLSKSADGEGVSMAVGRRSESLPLLLQVAQLPNDPALAKPLSSALAATARALTPVQVAIGAGVSVDGSYAELFRAFLGER